MRVLIADDNVSATRTLAILLEGWGYEPSVVHDGMSALAALRADGAPPMAVLDWSMPGMNGDAVCREVRQDVEHAYQYLVLVTGRAGRDQLLNGLEGGADDYLIKPVDPLELHARLGAGKRVLELQEKLLATQRMLRQQASRDALTGLWNRATILEILDRELARAGRDDRPLAVVMADVDNFKYVNDTHGHLIGDEALRQTARRLLSGLRPYDTVGRYGGEEFLLVLPNCGPDVALQLAERLRRGVEAEPVHDGKALGVTLSLGIAVSQTGIAADELLQKADEALYRAKNAGRNRAMLA